MAVGSNDGRDLSVCLSVGPYNPRLETNKEVLNAALAETLEACEGEAREDPEEDEDEAGARCCRQRKEELGKCYTS